MTTNSKTRFLSVGMPVFNSGEYLAETIESVLDQSHSDFELLISDNNSSDATADICNAYMQQDKRIKYWRNERNLGAPENYNIVFQRSTGTYFKWMSSNDLCGEGLFHLCINTLEARREVVLAYPKTRLFNESVEDYIDYSDGLELLQTHSYNRFTYLLDHIGLNNVMNGIIRREALAKTGLIRPFMASDICMTAELALHGKFVEVAGCYFYRRANESSMASKKSQQELLEHWTPGRGTPLRFQLWRYFLYLFGSIRRAQLSAGESARLAATILRRMISNRGKLMHDIFHQ